MRLFIIRLQTYRCRYICIFLLMSPVALVFDLFLHGRCQFNLFHRSVLYKKWPRLQIRIKPSLQRFFSLCVPCFKQIRNRFLRIPFRFSEFYFLFSYLRFISWLLVSIFRLSFRFFYFNLFFFFCFLLLLLNRLFFLALSRYDSSYVF